MLLDFPQLMTVTAAVTVWSGSDLIQDVQLNTTLSFLISIMWHWVFKPSWTTTVSSAQMNMIMFLQWSCGQHSKMRQDLSREQCFSKPLQQLQPLPRPPLQAKVMFFIKIAVIHEMWLLSCIKLNFRPFLPGTVLCYVISLSSDNNYIRSI